MKKCRVCLDIKADDEYYKHPKMTGGRDSKCKECSKAAVKANRDAKAQYYKEYDAWRFQNDPKVKERHKRYLNTPEGLASMRAAQKLWIDSNPEKRAAHIILGNAVKNGKIEKPKCCSRCGTFYPSRKIHAHHHDYTKPIDVTWLCVYCHVDEHKEELDAVS